ncbi:MAG TPA: WD40 repeat domain-containing protein, partial [Gemmataceae bacterium]|nr:WD40 repeat domain-containing protein [Gemmataceae bacterium]
MPTTISAHPCIRRFVPGTPDWLWQWGGLAITALLVGGCGPSNQDHKSAPPPPMIDNVVFIPPGDTAVTVAGMQIVFWDVASGKRQSTITEPALVDCVTISPDGKSLAIGHPDWTLVLQGLGPGGQRTELAGHEGDVHALAYAPDGKQLVVASGSTNPFNKRMQVKFWDPASGKDLGDLPMAGSAGPGMGGGRGPMARAPRPGKEAPPRSKTDGHTAMVTALAFCPDGKRLVTAGADLTLKVWDVKRRQVLVTMRGPTDNPKAVVVLPDGRTAVSAGSEPVIRIWDLVGGKQLYALTGQPSLLGGLAASPTGLLLASGGEDGMVYLWDLGQRKLAGKLQGHRGAIQAV